MRHRTALKRKAIALRKTGKSYAEILQQVPVAKSTLSLWLREVNLTSRQVHRLTQKKRMAQQKGAAVRRENRIRVEAKLHEQCRRDITNISKRELFLIGVTLYWAEGAKKTQGRAGTQVDFANSDPAMVVLFVRWLRECVGVKKEDIVVRLHIHESYRYNEARIKQFWSNKTTIPLSQFMSTNYKKHVTKTKYDEQKDYNGLVAIRVKKSTMVTRRIIGWINAIIATQN